MALQQQVKSMKGIKRVKLNIGQGIPKFRKKPTKSRRKPWTNGPTQEEPMSYKDL
jgi:hypothetical protein